MMILIPAYEPGPKLLDLIRELKKASRYPIVIVDVGSGPAYANLFTEAINLGCTVLIHSVNRGKGRALKTGMMYCMDQHDSEGLVCADCDGQHLPVDILAVVEKVRTNPGSIILGSRWFQGHVPLRSRMGNDLTRKVFRFVTGLAVQDTQTGLRGYPAALLPFACAVKGDRFEYEMNLLLQAKAAGIPIREIEITTIYEARKHTSHFRTVKDSIRVYLPILKFSFSSIVSAVIDFILLFLLNHLIGYLLPAVVIARICSARILMVGRPYADPNSQTWFRVKMLNLRGRSSQDSLSPLLSSKSRPPRKTRALMTIRRVLS